MLHRIGPLQRGPLGVKGLAGGALGEGGHGGLAAGITFRALLVHIPPLERIPLSRGVGGPGDGCAAAAGQAGNGGAAHAVKGQIAHSLGVAPGQAQHLGNGLGAEGQGGLLIGDDHLGGLAQRAVFRLHDDGVVPRVVAEHLVGKGDLEGALRGVVSLLGADPAGFQVHGLHAEGAGGQGEGLHRLKAVIGVVGDREVIDVLPRPRRPDGPLVIIQRGAEGQLAAVEHLGQEADVQIDAHLDQQRAAALDRRGRLGPLLVVVEVAP